MKTRSGLHVCILLQKQDYNDAMSSNIGVDKNRLEIQVERSNRKTIELRFVHADLLLIKAPSHLSGTRIEEILKSKAAWLKRARKRVRQVFPVPAMVNGESIFLLGEWHQLQIVHSRRSILETKAPYTILISQSRATQGAKALIPLFREITRKYTQYYAKNYAEKWNLPLSGIRITGAKSRWGSCGPQNTLNFSWRLAMTPLTSIEYVVVHELAHTIHRNHSAAFWEAINKMMPHYETGRIWLQKNGFLLPRIEA